jgi:hypothetical protein
LLFVAALDAVAMGVAFGQSAGSIDAPGQTVVAKVHAEGAQVYECKVTNGGTLSWQFGEPIATLLLNGRTIGRHYAGPSWEPDDGSTVVAKPIATRPGDTAADIPWLTL